MKRIAVFLLAMLCGGIYAATNILCTTQPMMILTRVVTKRVPGIKVEQLVSASVGCPHDYALTPNDMKKLTSADVIVLNGLGMEDFLSKALPRLKPGVVMIDSSKGVKGLLDSAVHEHRHDNSKKLKEGEKHDESCCLHEKNEHLFAGPATAAQVVKAIAEGLAEKDPKNAAQYHVNAATFASELAKIASEYKALGVRIPEDRRNIAAQHGIFDYLADCANLKIKAYLQSHTGAEPSAAEIRNLIGKLNKEKVVLILAEKGYPDRVTKLISKETGIPVLTLDAYPPNGTTEPDLYLKMFRKNLSKMKAFFQK